MKNVFFDTCVNHQAGIDLLFRVIEPETGHYFDDTKRYIDALDLPSDPRHKIFEGNVRRAFPRLDAVLKTRGK